MRGISTITGAAFPVLTILLAGLTGPVYALAFDKTRAVEVAKVVLLQAQSLSFSHDVEFCGYITVDADGQMVATDPVAGSLLSCEIEDDPVDGSIIASYHTHGSYNPLIDSEIPSSFDVVGDLTHERNGFVSTPGGRFWFIRSARGSAELLCGIGCLLMDGDFEKSGTDLVERQYNLEALFERERAEK